MRFMGEQFLPTDAELIKYLKRFLTGKPFPNHCPIQLGEIYCDKPPWEIIGTSQENVWYLITPLKKVKKQHKRFCRKVGNGSWSGQTSGDPIKNRKGTVVGFRKSLVYESSGTGKEKKKKNGVNWLMREYSVGDDYFRKKGIPKQDVVLCQIKKHVKEKTVKNVVALEEKDVEGVIQAMLHGPNYDTTQTNNNELLEVVNGIKNIVPKAYDQQIDSNNINFWKEMINGMEDIYVPQDLVEEVRGWIVPKRNETVDQLKTQQSGAKCYVLEGY